MSEPPPPSSGGLGGLAKDRAGYRASFAMDSFASYTHQVLLTGTQADIASWLLTYPIFLPAATPSLSKELFSLWEQSYAALPEDGDARTAQLARLNSVAAEWCRTFPGDLSAKQLSTIFSVVGKYDTAIANEIKLLMLRKQTPTLRKEPSSTVITVDTIQPSSAIEKRAMDFMDIPESALARELTIIEWQLFEKVNLRSLLTVKNHEGDSLFEPIIEQYKLISHWVATEILITKSTEMRVQVLEKFIRLASHCLQLNNFNTFMEIVSGLNHNSVQRLKSLWERVSDKAREQWRTMDKLMSPHHNFRHYRRELKQRKLPVLPYFGIYLRDFTFINDGNDRYKPSGLINEKYVHLLSERAKEVQNFQSVPYTLATQGRSPAAQIFFSLLTAEVINDEEELYLLSLKAQPSLWTDASRDDLSEDSESINSILTLRREPSTLSEMTDDPVRESDINSALLQQYDAASFVVTNATSPATARGEGMDLTNLTPPPEETTPVRRERRKLNLKHFRTDSKMTFSGEQAAISARGCQTAIVPADMDELFAATEKVVHRFFNECYQSARSGTITIFDERYLLLRSSSLSVDFYNSIAETLTKGLALSASQTEIIAQKILFDLAHAVGKADARNFMKKMNLGRGKQGLSAGPIYFAYTGWAVTHLRHFGSPEDLYHIFFNNSHSSESYSWMNQPEETKKTPHHPVCVFASGYSSGWASEAEGMDLVSVELECIAMGGEACRFVMASPGKAHTCVDEYCEENYVSDEKRNSIFIHKYGASKLLIQELSGTKETNSPSPAPTKEKEKKEKREKKREKEKERRGSDASDGLKGFIGRLKRRTSTLPSASTPAEAIPTPSMSPSATSVYAGGRQISPEVERMVMNQAKRSLDLVRAIFQKQVLDPRHGQVSIDGHRHLFIRAEAISYDFFHLLQDMFPDNQREEAQLFAAKFIYDVGLSLGKTDYRFYRGKMSQASSSFVESFLTLPALLAYMGWGVMKLQIQDACFDLRSSSERSNFYLKFSIQDGAEAIVWKKKLREEKLAGLRLEEPVHDNMSNADEPDPASISEDPRADANYSRPPVCAMTTGYTTGFVNECIRMCKSKSGNLRATADTGTSKLDLAVLEVSCQALGHGSECTFIMAPRESVAQCARQYLDRKKRSHYFQHLRLTLLPGPSVP